MFWMESKKQLLVPLRILMLLFLLHLSCLLYSGAVPVTRLPASRNQEPQLPYEMAADQVMVDGLPMMEEEFIHGRMDIQSNDYPGTGANNRHDPRPPGRP